MAFNAFLSTWTFNLKFYSNVKSLKFNISLRMEINSPSHLEFWLIKSKEQILMLDLLPKAYCNLNDDIIYFFISYDLIVNMKIILFCFFGNVVEIYNVI